MILKKRSNISFVALKIEVLELGYPVRTTRGTNRICECYLAINL